MILLFGAAFGVMAAMPLRHASMPEAAANSQVRFRDLIDVFRDKPFARFLLGIYGPLIPFFFILPFYSAYQLKEVGIDAMHLAWIQVIYFVLKIIVLKASEGLLHRVSPRTIFIITIPFYVAFFILMGMAQHVSADASREFESGSVYWHAVWPLAAAWGIASIGDGLWAVAQGTMLYGIVPESNNRPAYFAAFNLMAFLSYSVGPLMAWQILEWVGDAKVQVLGHTFGHFQLFFVGCGVMMAFCSITLIQMPNSREEVLAEKTAS